MEPSEVSQRHELEERLRFETLLTDISARFVNLPAEKIDGAIEDSLRLICKYLGIDLCSLWQWTVETSSFMTLTHLYSPPEGPEHPVGIDAAEAVPWVLQKMHSGETLVISTEQLPPEAARDQETRRHFGVKSSVVIPLSAGLRPLIGVLSFDALHEARTWLPETVKRLTLIAQVFTNALERKCSEQALIKSEARLSLAADSAEVGLWELDCKIRNFWATERARAIFGYGPDEMITMERFEASIHPDDLQMVRRIIARALDDGESIYVEYRIQAGDGRTRWISSCGRPFFTSTEEPDRLLGVSLDISERKKMEGDLQKQLREIEVLRHRLENENLYLRKELRAEKGFEKIVGKSKAIKSVVFSANQVAPTDATVLILGETGTGKGLVANAIHGMSTRKDHPLVTVNCSALPKNLIESELFGREKGAFTSAHDSQPGRFDIADGGTIFLDEIGEMPLELQSRLLRVLQDGEFERLGSSKTVKVDIRVIAATSRDLKEEVLNKRFRADLFYRLNVFPIVIPPLWQRKTDIPLLAQYFTEKYAQKMARRIESIPKATIDMFKGYDWPGNVRELEHVIERGVIITSGSSLKVAEQLQSCMPKDTDASGSLKDLASTEREHIQRVLQETDWRIEGPAGAASILKLHPSTLRFRLKKLGIRRPV